MKKQSFLFCVACLFLIGIPLTVAAQNSTWVAPKETDSLKNPLDHDKRIELAGKQIFGQLCEVCHGKKGAGDGITASSLKPKPADLSSDAVQEQPEGALYWKISEGRAPMPGFKNQLNDKQVWALVVFIKSLAKEQNN